MNKHSDQKKKKAEFFTSTLKYLSEGFTEINDLFGVWAGHSRSRKSMLCDRRSKRDLQSKYSNLKQQKFIKERKIQGKIFVELSKKGRETLLKKTLQERPILPFNQTCIVMYDFPISAKKGRDAFRYFLKTAGFTKVQMSVWKTDRDVLMDVQDFTRRTGSQKWVDVFLATKM